jgi:hypothetical protein
MPTRERRKRLVGEHQEVEGELVDVEFLVIEDHMDESARFDPLLRFSGTGTCTCTGVLGFWR